MNPPLRIGIVGAGRNTAERHIPGLRAIADVKITGVCNRSRASSERAARAHGIPRVYDDWHALVTADDTDAVLIGAWPSAHCAVTVAALQAGKHVLCEARMAMDLPEARRMLAAAQAAPRLVAQLVPAPFTLRVDPLARRLIAAGFVGTLLSAEVRALSGAFFRLREIERHLQGAPNEELGKRLNWLRRERRFRLALGNST